MNLDPTVGVAAGVKGVYCFMLELSGSSGSRKPLETKILNHGWYDHVNVAGRGYVK